MVNRAIGYYRTLAQAWFWLENLILEEPKAQKIGPQVKIAKPPFG